MDRKTRKILFKFSCGCEWDESVREQFIHGNQKMHCPKHTDTILVHRITTCIECGIGIQTGPRGGLPHRCKECAKRRIQTNRRNDSELPTKKDKTHRQHDCIHYNECLSPDGCLMKNSRACIDCPHYTKSPGLEVLDYIRTDGRFPRER